MGWHTDFFEVEQGMFSRKNMADALLSREASRQGVKIMALAHTPNYFKYLSPKGETIWSQKVETEYQTEIINEILKKNSPNT